MMHQLSKCQPPMTHIPSGPVVVTAGSSGQNKEVQTVHCPNLEVEGLVPFLLCPITLCLALHVFVYKGSQQMDSPQRKSVPELTIRKCVDS